MRQWIIVLVPLAILLTGCAAPTQPDTPTPTATPSVAASPTETVVPTDPPSPTPTATPEPSATPAPTSTPQPTLPTVPAGMSVERLDPPLYAVRAVAPGANLRAAPSAEAEAVGRLECGAAPVQLDAAARDDASGQIWYHLAEGGWIREEAIQTHADLSAAEAAAQAANCAAPAVTDYTPAAATVWNFVQSQDVMTGACNTGPILPPYGLVQITPVENGLIWKSQEPAPYTFGKVNTNAYAYAGPTALGDGTVTMNLTFTSAATLQMTRAFVPNGDPGCTHTHTYSATFQWAIP